MNCLFPGKFISFSRNNFRYSRFFQVFGFSSLFSRFSRYLLHIPGFSRFFQDFPGAGHPVHGGIYGKKKKKKKKKKYGKKCRHAEYSRRRLKNSRWRRFSLIKIICSRLGFLFKFESEEKINSYAWLFKLIARN